MSLRLSLCLSLSSSHPLFFFLSGCIVYFFLDHGITLSFVLAFIHSFVFRLYPLSLVRFVSLSFFLVRAIPLPSFFRHRTCAPFLSRLLLRSYYHA